MSTAAFKFVALALALATACHCREARPNVRVDKTWVTPGDAVAGAWQLPPGRACDDLAAALYVVGDSKPLWRASLCSAGKACGESGTFSSARAQGWSAPSIAGKHINWEIRLKCSGTVLATSEPLVYMPPAPVSAAATSLGRNAVIAGSYHKIASKYITSMGAWVGLFLVSELRFTRDAALWYIELPKGSAAGSFHTGMTEHSKPFRTPRSASANAGPWEFRYVSASGMLAARSRPMIFLPDVACRALNKPRSNIKHIITISTENHSFDSFFGNYCTAPAGSAPSCTVGRACCEGKPTDVGPFRVLTDAENLRRDFSNSVACTTCQMNGGKMDRFRSGCPCSTGDTLAAAAYTGTKADALAQYFEWAKGGSLADRFFQNAVGASSMNDVYLAYGRFLFTNNDKVPNSPLDVGTNRYSESKKQNFYEPSIGDLLELCGIDWGVFPEGYSIAAANITANPWWPRGFDASDVGQSYSPYVQDKPGVYADSEALLARIALGTLPAVSYIRSLGKHSEHPLYSDLASSQAYIKTFVDAVLASPKYSRNTVILITPDEAGGYFDHVPPPGTSPVDNRLYGPRQPLVAIGFQVNVNSITHVQMEMSSIIRTIEWNWLGGQPGQLKARDAVVNGLGSLFNASRTGVPVP